MKRIVTLSLVAAMAVTAVNAETHVEKTEKVLPDVIKYVNGKKIIYRKTIRTTHIKKSTHVVNSNWKLDGNAVAYYQTNDAGTHDIADGATTTNDIDVQLRAVNDNLFMGVGAGVELSGLYSNSDFSEGVNGAALQRVFPGTGASRIQSGGVAGRGFQGTVTQAYITFNAAEELGSNTLVKIGRQQLPKSLSPFAFSETWQPLKNSFDAALIVNKDLPKTTIVYAAVQKANSSVGDIGNFATVNPDDVMHMITVQNKTLPGVTYTGSIYHAPDKLVISPSVNNDITIYWADLRYGAEIMDVNLNVAMQGGYIDGEKNIYPTDQNTFAGGMKMGAAYNMESIVGIPLVADMSVSISSVNEGEVDLLNATDIKTPLYTQMILNQKFIKNDANTIVGRVGFKAFGGKFGIAYGYTELGDMGDTSAIGTEAVYQELDVTLKTKITPALTMFTGYIHRDYDQDKDKLLISDYSDEIARVWVKYNF